MTQPAISARHGTFGIHRLHVYVQRSSGRQTSGRGGCFRQNNQSIQLSVISSSWGMMATLEHDKNGATGSLGLDSVGTARHYESDNLPAYYIPRRAPHMKLPDPENAFKFPDCIAVPRHLLYFRCLQKKLLFSRHLDLPHSKVSRAICACLDLWWGGESQKWDGTQMVMNFRDYVSPKLYDLSYRNTSTTILLPTHTQKGSLNGAITFH